MRVLSITFSPTGGTQKVAEIITNAWELPVHPIDLSNAEADNSSLTLEKEDIALIAIPSYGGRVPHLATERIAKLHASQTPCVIVCVYGNRAYEDTLAELYDTAKKSGFCVVAAIAAIAEHSILHQYAAGRPDNKDKSELQDFAQKILEKIHNHLSEISEPDIPGNRPYKKAGGSGLVPKADKTCTGCGLCAKQCPAQAINKENLHLTDNQKCISCMRCVVQCPQSARKVNKAMVSAAALALKKACSVRKENELYI